MSLATITGTYFKYAGTKYFLNNAQTVSPGSTGEKADPINKPGKLEVKDHIPPKKFEGKIKVIGPITLDASHSSKADFSAMVSASLAVVGFSGSLGAVYDNLASSKLKLVQLYIEEDDMQYAANHSPKALDNLRDYGGDARMVHTTWEVVEAEFAQSFTAGTSFELSVDAAGIASVKAKGGGVVSGRDTLSLAPKMCLAYGMLKLDWTQGKGQIESTSMDEVGMY